MEPTPTPKPPEEKKPINWPVALNLGLLLLVFLVSGGGVSSVLVALAILLPTNGLAALIVAISGKMTWVPAFLLAALVVLLVGLGACALILSNLHVNH